MAESERVRAYRERIDQLVAERKAALRQRDAEILARREATPAPVEDTLPPETPEPEAFSAGESAAEVNALKGDGPNPFRKDLRKNEETSKTLPLDTPPLMKSSGEEAGSPSKSRQDIVDNLRMRYMKENNVAWMSIPPDERRDLQARFEKEATERVTKATAQKPASPSPLLVHSPQKQREAVREGPPLLPGTDIRPMRWLADGFDAAIDMVEKTTGADLPEGNPIRAAAEWSAPFTLAMTERGISEADKGTGELTEQGYFDKFTKMSPYQALAPYIAGKLTDKYPDLEWGSDEHLEWIQKGGDWMDLTDVPGQVFEEQWRQRAIDLFGVDIIGGAGYISDVPVATAHVGADVMLKPFEYGPLMAARNIEKGVRGVLGADTEDTAIPEEIPNPVPAPSELFGGDARGSKAILNAAVAAPLMLVEPDALSAATLGAGKALKMTGGGISRLAGKRLMTLADDALEAGLKAFDETLDLDAAYGAIASKIPGLAPPVRDVLKTRFALNMFSTGVESAPELQAAVRTSKSPELTAKMQQAQVQAKELSDELNAAWGDVDDALKQMEAAREKLSGATATSAASQRQAAVERMSAREAKAAKDAAEKQLGQKTQLQEKLAGATKADAARLGAKRQAAQGAQAEMKKAQKALVRAEQRVRKADSALDSALTPGQKKVPKAEAAYKKALADRRKIIASFDDTTTPAARKTIEAANRRVQQTQKKLADAQKAPAKTATPAATERATQRRVDAALGKAQASENLDSWAKKYAAAEQELAAATSTVSPEVAAKYGNFSSKRIKKEIQDLGKKIKKVGKVSPADLNHLILELEYVKAKEAFDAVNAAALKTLTKKQQAVFRRAVKSKRVLDSSSKVAETFRRSIRETQEQLRAYRDMIARGESGALKVFDETQSALAKAVETSDKGVVSILDKDALVAELTKRYGEVPEGMKPFIEAGQGSTQEFRKALGLEKQAAQEAQQRAGRAYQAGHLLDDTVVQRTSAYTGGRLLNAEALAINARRMMGRLGLLRPIAARGVGMSGDIADGIYRHAFELNRNAELQATKILEAGGPDLLAQYLFTRAPVDVKGVRMSGNAMSAPVTRARKHLQQMAEAGLEEFTKDTSVRALAAANIASTQAGDAGLTQALKSLHSKALDPKFSDDALKQWMWTTAPGLHKAMMGVADEGGRAALFQSRALLAAANNYDLTELAVKAGWAGPASPVDGSLANAIRFLTTRTGSRAADRGIPKDVTAKALQEALDFSQRFSTGVASSRSTAPRVPGLSFVFAAAKGAEEAHEVATLSTYAGRKVFVPENIAKALREIPDKIVKETEQYASGADQAGFWGGRLDAGNAARTVRMSMVGGNKLPRLRLYGGTQVGDAQQMAMHPDVGPVMAARVAAQAVPHIVPGAGPVIARALRGPIETRPLFASTLDDQIMAVVEGEERLIQLADGPITTKALQREAEMAGVVDALPQKDLYDALSEHPKAKNRALDFVGRNLVDPYQQSDLVKVAMQALEHEQRIKRLALYIELRKTHGADKAGKIMRDALFDWSLGVAPWEAETIFKLAAFHTYRRGKWNLMQQVVLRDLAGIEKGRAMSILMPGTSVPMKAMRVGQLPSKFRDWELQDRELSEAEQYDAALEAERSTQGARSGFQFDSERLSPEYAEGYTDRTGKRPSVAQIYLVQGAYEDMLLDTILAYDMFNYMASHATGGSDYQTEADWQDMGYQLAQRLVETTHGDPLTERFFEKTALEALGVDDPYAQGEDSKKRNGVKVAPNVAGLATAWERLTGFDLVGMERGPDGKIIYSLDRSWAQMATNTLMNVPGILQDMQRQYATADTPYWDEGYAKGFMAMVALNLALRLELVDAEKQIDMRAGAAARALKDEEIQTENRAVPSLKGRRR